MTSALVSNNSVVEFYPGDVPARIYFSNGGTVDGAQAGYSNENGYTILPAAYTDSAPQPWSYSTGNSYAISNGAVSITRTWVTPSQPVPPSVTNAQARYVLMQTPSPVNAGKTLFDDVDAAVAAGGGVDHMAWEYSNYVSRNSSLVASMAGALGMTSEQVDALFIAAAVVSF